MTDSHDRHNRHRIVKGHVERLESEGDAADYYEVLSAAQADPRITDDSTALDDTVEDLKRGGELYEPGYDLLRVTP